MLLPRVCVRSSCSDDHDPGNDSLINDDMFGALAVTIMGGLFIGTVITLVILPVFYSLFFKIKAE